jgi:hypothetical protein
VFNLVERYASKRKESRYRLENRLYEQIVDIESEPPSQALELHSLAIQFNNMKSQFDFG